MELDLRSSLKIVKRFVALLGILLSEGSFSNVVIGSFGPPIDRVRETKTETESPLSLKPYIGFFYQMDPNALHSYSFEFDYVFPQTSYSDMEEPVSKSRRLIFQANHHYLFYQDFLYSIAGLSTVATKVYGDGSSVTVSGSQYYAPGEEADSSYNTIVNLGVGAYLGESYLAEFKAHIWEILNSQSRGVSLSLALKWRIF